jgi:hypothetical protein
VGLRLETAATRGYCASLTDPASDSALPKHGFANRALMKDETVHEP